MRFFLLPAVLLAATAMSPVTAAPVAVPPLAFTARTLPNGLRVYAMPDKTGTTVSVQIWYDVGSKDDPRGRSGFAHLFEHLMFKATRNMPSEMLDRLTEDVGGANNASTDDDYTEYHETAPANHLERLIWAEGERLGGLVIDQPTFAAERLVVEEELRSGLARPYGQLFGHDLPTANYRVHPYARPGIGSIADLDSASVEDVRAFHATYYRPDNAVLVVSGNFDPAKLNQWVDRYLGVIKRPDRPIPRVAVAEPARTAPARFTVTAANTPLPAVTLSWLLPPSSDADHAAANMIDGLLSGGESSRLYQSLVYRDRVASEADVETDFKKGPGLFTAYAIVAGGKNADMVEAGLRREIALLRDRPVSAAELDRVKNLVVTSALRERETAEGRASLVAEGVIIEGDPNAADRRLAAIQAVTAADVQRVARRLLPDDRAVAIRYGAPAKGATDRDPIALASGVVTAPLATPANVPIVTALGATERAAPPAPGAAVSPAVPVASEQKLANGLRIVVLERHDLPIVTALLVSPHGSAEDPEARLGRAELVADLMTKGTPTRSATQFADAIESLGASISADASRDAATVSMTARSDRLQPAMAILADAARNPVFAADELDRARSEALDDLTVAMKRPATLASLVATRAAFGAAPYGKPEAGTPKTLAALTRADMTAGYRAIWSPASATLVLAGDVTPAAGRALAQSLFGDWTAPTMPAASLASAALPKPRAILLDMPGVPQAAVTLVRPTLTRTDRAYYPLLVANAVLGGGYSSRLNLEVRIRRGLAYGAGSRLAAGRMPGPFAASTQTKNASVPEVIGLMRDEMTRLGREEVPQAELAARKATLIGGFGEGIETTDGLAGAAAGLIAEDVPLAEMGLYAGRIEAVTPAALRAAAAAHLDPAAASLAVVGDAKTFAAGLAAKGILMERIAADTVDPGSVGLK
ncbi:pitrilysin family protein [Sphingomonas sp. BIUV-7]|uniref:Pitrilysin family protein n=1 Tax=Sphingomonas natans TaxID=3063330 RepID=A0ABT8YFJ4_9SPHN|nr:pitrilysin family protein [Sphingomonas sp. BIUV-7]MDO6416475.1 pitrilysin family protein [Sphingomonas sp. BIUV-7]